jgi:transcriptional regulator with XRE-family HTH domain
MGIGEKLSFFRKASGMTFREVSSGSGLSVSHLHAIEHGSIRSVKLETLEKLSKCFGIEMVEWLCNENEEEWFLIIREAKQAGVGAKDIKDIIQYKKWEQTNT